MVKNIQWPADAILIWGSMISINDEIKKNVKSREVMFKNIQQWLEKMKFENGQRYNTAL